MLFHEVLRLTVASVASVSIFFAITSKVAHLVAFVAFFAIAPEVATAIPITTVALAGVTN